MHTYIHTYMHIHTCIHTYIHTIYYIYSMCVCVCICIYIYMHIQIYKCSSVSECVYVYLSIHIYIFYIERMRTHMQRGHENSSMNSRKPRVPHRHIHIHIYRMRTHMQHQVAFGSYHSLPTSNRDPLRCMRRSKCRSATAWCECQTKS